MSKFGGGPEIFFSFQGEGKNCGRPSVFVRLSGCNLACVWCDTPYTWDWKKFRREEEAMELGVEEVAHQILRLAAKHFSCKNIVLTGGEPMLQQRELAELMRLLNSEGEFFFEVETNTTILPSAEFDTLIDQYNCSPKLGNSSNSKKWRESPKVYRFFTPHPKAFFKFVVAHPSDLQEILALAAVYKIPKEKIYLMPEGTTAPELAEKQEWLPAACTQNGFLFSPRLHIEKFGNRRGC